MSSITDMNWIYDYFTVGNSGQITGCVSVDTLLVSVVSVEVDIFYKRNGF